MTLKNLLCEKLAAKSKETQKKTVYTGGDSRGGLSSLPSRRDGGGTVQSLQDAGDTGRTPPHPVDTGF
jgi:hypothetical protein